MKLTSYIHPAIRRALLVFLVTLAVVSAIIATSGLYRGNDEEDYRNIELDIRKWKSRINEANRNNQILVDHEDSFSRLKDKAVIGDENRLSWVEVIQKVADRLGLASVKYSIASQEIDRHDNIKSEFTGLDVYRSVMSLDMKLMHEGDFITMMNALRNEAKGLFVVDKCSLELLNPEPSASAASADNIRAACELSWYTMKRSGQG